jgi:thiol-disulfide isomerase/thioredoxin
MQPQQMPPQQMPPQQMQPQQMQPQQMQPQQMQQQPVQQTPPQQPKFESFSTVVSEVTEETLAFVKNGPTIILFYAPWCVHCVHFKPIYEKIAATCLEKQIGVRFAALDGSKFPKVIQEYKLKAYPTIGVIRNNEFTMYSGQRSEPDIIEWIQTL